MKLFTIVAMFAFIAVQLSCSTPIPDEEKKEAEPVPAVVPVEVSSHAVPEVKSEQSDAVASLAEPAVSLPHAEEKKA